LSLFSEHQFLINLSACLLFSTNDNELFAGAACVILGTVPSVVGRLVKGAFITDKDADDNLSSIDMAVVVVVFSLDELVVDQLFSSKHLSMNGIRTSLQVLSKAFCFLI
jgi:hypothetical protein